MKIFLKIRVKNFYSWAVHFLDNLIHRFTQCRRVKLEHIIHPIDVLFYNLDKFVMQLC